MVEMSPNFSFSRDHFATGRLVVSPFLSEAFDVSWWQSQFNTLANQGVRVAFVPLFLSWKNYAQNFANIR
jgi:hypothetical protein